MKTFSEYKNNGRILLFDVDDTLVHTTARIGVIKNGIVTKKISSKTFNDYNLRPGESFDFTEFSDYKHLEKEIPTKYLDTLKREYKKGSQIGILTARDSCQGIKKFLKKHNIDIDKNFIFATDDPKLGLSGTVNQRKSEVISILYHRGYTTFIFFDDSEKNLESAKALEKVFGIDVVTIKT